MPFYSLWEKKKNPSKLCFTENQKEARAGEGSRMMKQTVGNSTAAPANLWEAPPEKLDWSVVYGHHHRCGRELREDRRALVGAYRTRHDAHSHSLPYCSPAT